MDDTGISFDQQVSEYLYDMQTVIHGYIDAVDEDGLFFIEEVQNGQAWKGKKITVGTANSRMEGDIARINYILQNYDSMELSPRINGEYKNRNGSRSQMVVLSKKINGTYFVIEAVPDTGKIGIVSAYMDKNRASQVPDENTPGRNVQDELASALNDSLPDGGGRVKQFSIRDLCLNQVLGNDLLVTFFLFYTIATVVVIFLTQLTGTTISCHRVATMTAE